MQLITGSVFLAGALLSCLLPISLLISFATFFYRQVRKVPQNAATSSTIATTATTATTATSAMATTIATEPSTPSSEPYTGQ